MSFSWARAGTWVMAVAFGAVYGAAGATAYGYTMGFLPVGLVLSVLGIGALVIAVRLLTDRWAALATGLGAVVAGLIFAGPGPGGSVIAHGGALGVVWSIAVPVVVAMIVAWPDRPRGRPAGAAGRAN